MNEPELLPNEPAGGQCVETRGPWPFVSRRVYRLADQSRRIWSSRHHRKGLRLPEAGEAISVIESLLRCLWMPRKLNWWIGIIFAAGSLLFMIASVLCLSPALASAWTLNATQINAIFFAGSIPFTTAAYLQLFQAANAGEFLVTKGSLGEKGSGLFSAKHPAGRSGKRVLTPFHQYSLFGWRPGDIGWLSSALQFAGTILFNMNTFDAMIPSLDWFQQDLLVWAPNIIGSILFLASGYLAFIETCHAHWAWRPKSISWWVVFTNILGCVGFMISAALAIVLPGPEHAEILTLSVTFTLLGAIGFLIGSLLMLPEAVWTNDP